MQGCDMPVGHCKLESMAVHGQFEVLIHHSNGPAILKPSLFISRQALPAPETVNKNQYMSSS